MTDVGDQPPAGDGGVISIPLPPLRYALHSVLSSLHSTHGLYPLLAASSSASGGVGGGSSSLAAYRQYLSRKMRRLRHAHPSVRKEHGHGKGRGTFVQRDRVVGGRPDAPAALADYCARAAAAADAAAASSAPPPVDPLPPGYRHLHLALLRAERAWAHAGEVRSAPPPRPRAQGGHPKGRSVATARSRRAHTIGLLKRSAAFAAELSAMARLRSDPLSALECESYAAWCAANVAVERGRWDEAAAGLGRAAEILGALAAADGTAAARVAGESGGRAEELVAAVAGLALQEQDAFGSRREALAPMLAFCRHELSRTSGAGVVTDAARASAVPGAPDAAAGAVSFRGRAADPHTVPGLRAALARAVDAGKGGADDKSYLQALGAYDDALKVVQAEQSRLSGAARGSKVDARRADLAALSGHVRHAKMALSMNRTEGMIADLLKEESAGSRVWGGTGKNVEAVAHMYDFLWQTSREVLELPHPEEEMDEAAGMGGGAVDDDFWAEGEAHVLRYRAMRAYYVGRMYAEEEKFQHATVLYDQSLALSHQAVEQLTACEMDEDLVASMTTLASDVQGAKCRARASAYLTGGGRPPARKETGGPSAPERTLLQRLDDYDPGPTAVGDGSGGRYALADATPAVSSVPCKPTFFDIAFNYLDMPDLGAHIRAHEEKKTAAAGRGLLGWFRRK